MDKQATMPRSLESAEKLTVASGIFYALLSLFVIPYYLNLLMLDVYDIKTITWYEFAYHLINCVIVVALFREYLGESFFMFRLRTKECFFVVKQAVIAMLVYTGIVGIAAGLWESDWLSLASWSTLPMFEMELLFFAGDMVCYNILGGVICAVILAPVTVCCLYYCIGFVPAYNKRPWLGYLVAAVLIACVHVRNAITTSDALTELVAFGAQLPVHMIACWAYKKSDSIFVPILALTIANLLACGVIITTLLLGA